jgi:hypothetical protein
MINQYQERYCLQYLNNVAPAINSGGSIHLRAVVVGVTQRNTVPRQSGRVEQR